MKAKHNAHAICSSWSHVLPAAAAVTAEAAHLDVVPVGKCSFLPFAAADATEAAAAAAAMANQGKLQIDADTNLDDAT